MRVKIAAAAALIALALTIQAIWYHGMSRSVVMRANDLRRHLEAEWKRGGPTSEEAARLCSRTVQIDKIVCNGWGPIFFVPLVLYVCAVGVLLLSPRKGTGVGRERGASVRAGARRAPPVAIRPAEEGGEAEAGGDG